MLRQPPENSLQVLPVFCWRRDVDHNVVDVREAEVQTLQHFVYRYEMKRLCQRVHLTSRCSVGEHGLENYDRPIWSLSGARRHGLQETGALVSSGCDEQWCCGRRGVSQPGAWAPGIGSAVPGRNNTLTLGCGDRSVFLLTTRPVVP